MGVTLVRPGPSTPIGLDEFVAYLDERLDVTSEASIIAAAPALMALVRNRRFLTDFIAGTIASPDFQHDNDYSGRVLVLGRGLHYMLRVVEWFPPETATPAAVVFTRPNQSMYGIAHTHAFSLLTACYYGPGYETEIYDWDPASLRADGPYDGRPIALHYVGRHRLSDGTVMFYPAHRVAHVQLPATGYSITINLMVRSPEDERYEQHYFDLEQRTITRSAKGPTVGPFEPWMHALALAATLDDPELAPDLETIAAQHPTARVRRAAARARRGEVGPD